jgi:hypothetical protein
MSTPILVAMTQYAASQGVSRSRVGVYRFEEGAEHFTQKEWDDLKADPTFEERQAFIPYLGQVFTVGLFVTPESTIPTPSVNEPAK